MFFQFPGPEVIENGELFQFPFPVVLAHAVFFGFPVSGVIETNGVFFQPPFPSQSPSRSLSVPFPVPFADLLCFSRI